MMRPVLRIMSGLMLLCLLLIVVVIGLPDDTHAIEAFMTAPENCGGQCLLGIQPGITTVGESMALLRDHDWVGVVEQRAPGTGYARIDWTWSGQQPTIINTDRDGRITFYWEDDSSRPQLLSDMRIDTVTIYTHMRIYSLQAFLGDTPYGSASLRPDGNLAYSVVYDNPAGGLINLYVELACPVHLLRYWDARARLTMSIGRVDSPFVHPVRLPDACDNGGDGAVYATLFTYY